MAVAAMSRHAMRLECSQAQLDVGIGRAIVEQAERLGDYKATRCRSHKGNGDGFTGEFNSAALVESRSNVRLVLLRNMVLIGCESRMAVMSAAWFVEFRQRLPWLVHVD